MSNLTFLSPLTPHQIKQIRYDRCTLEPSRNLGARLCLPKQECFLLFLIYRWSELDARLFSMCVHSFHTLSSEILADSNIKIPQKITSRWLLILRACLLIGSNVSPPVSSSGVFPNAEELGEGAAAARSAQHRGGHRRQQVWPHRRQVTLELMEMVACDVWQHQSISAQSDDGNCYRLRRCLWLL